MSQLKLKDDRGHGNFPAQLHYFSETKAEANYLIILTSLGYNGIKTRNPVFNQTCGLTEKIIK